MFRVLILVLVLVGLVVSKEKNIQPQVVSTAFTVDIDDFGNAETEYRASVEAKRVEDSVALERVKKEDPIVPSSNVSKKIVTIDPKSPEGIVIDQFDRDIASLRSHLYANVIFKKTAELDIDDQIKYMQWLLVNRYLDTVSVVRACETMMLIYQIESEKLTVVRSVSGGDAKGSIQAHIRKAWDNVGKFSALLLEISDNVGVK
jgi:hypothetical protein